MTRKAIWTFCIALVGSFVLAACGGSDPSGPTDDGGPTPGTGEYPTLEIYAGTGIVGLSPDGTELADVELSTPQDMSFGPDGNAYICDWNNHRILKVENGRIQTVIGTGTLGWAPEGLATNSGLNHPTNVNFDSKGRIILSAWHNSKIMRCDLGTGMMVRLVGLESQNTSGNRCFNGDDHPANETCLDLPICTAFDSKGNLYVADQKNLRVRKVTPVDGEIRGSSPIETVVGNGDGGDGGLGAYNGNDILATDASLSAPGGQSAPPSSRILIDSNDVLYLADSLNNMVRKVDLKASPSQRYIELVAGGGLGLDETLRPKPGYTGDGESATQSSLFFPTDVAMDSQGNLYIADCWNNVIRKVDTAGIITTFAGNGETHPSSGNTTPADLGAGGRPTDVYLDRPYGLAIDAQDNIYIVDTHHHLIWVARKKEASS